MSSVSTTEPGAGDQDSVDVDAEPIPGPPPAPEPELLSNDWNFRRKLLQIARKIKPDELKQMKFMLEGEGGTKRKALEEIKDAVDLIRHLQHREKLDKFNLLHLQSLIWSLENKNLHQDMVKLARECEEQPLHFFTETTELGEGKRDVQFHVQGKEIKISEVDYLRILISKYVGVPITQVHVSGAIPFKSIIITFIIPTLAAEALFYLSSQQKRSFQDLRVDKITIGKKEVILLGESFAEVLCLTENDEIQRITRAKHRLERELENAQRQLLQKEQDLEIMLKENNRLKVSYDKKDKDESQYEKGLATFKEKYPDAVNDVLHLIQMKTDALRNKEKMYWNKYMDVARKYDRLSETMQQRLSTWNQRTGEDVPSEPDTRICMKDRCREALHEISNALTPEHKNILKGDTPFSEDDALLLQQDPHKFLHVLLQNKNEDIKDLYQHVMSMLSVLKDDELNKIAENNFKASLPLRQSKLSSTKHLEQLRSKPEIDPKNRSFYGRSKSMIDFPLIEKEIELQQSMEEIKMQLQEIKNYFELG